MREYRKKKKNYYHQKEVVPKRGPLRTLNAIYNSITKKWKKFIQANVEL